MIAGCEEGKHRLNMCAKLLAQRASPKDHHFTSLITKCAALFHGLKGNMVYKEKNKSKLN